MKHAPRFWLQLLSGLWLASTGLSVQAQDPTLTKLRQQIETQATQSLPEKLFVHTDRQFYMAGEVMWFRLFYVDGMVHQPLDISKVAYLELLDKDQKAVLQTKVGLGTGKGSGSLLLPLTLTSGHYVVRAYTAWMKNTSPDFLFEKPITIVNSFRKLGLPATNDSLTYNAQFFPEGGHLVAGLPAKVAFKVIDRKIGRGVDCQGFLLSQNDTVARFTSLKFGMGSFSFTPTRGTNYRVLLNDRRGHTISGSLPAIDEQGYMLRVDEVDAGQLKVTVRTNKTDSQNPVVYLIGHTRQSVKVAQVHNLQSGEATFLIPKNSLGEGISHLTLFDGAGKPVCERLYFKHPQSSLTVQIQPDKPQYATRAPVTVNLATTDPSGKPLVSDLSVSVYRLDTLQTSDGESLPDYLWLTSDLRGPVESPDYYLTQTGPEADAAADNLMLTQGWRRFRWETETVGKQSADGAIPEHRSLAIQGRVIDKRTGAPASNVLTYLSVPGAVSQLQSIRSDAQGRVRFEMDNFYGAKDVVLQIASADSAYRIEVSSPFTDASTTTPLPVFTLSEPDRSALMDRSLSMQVQTSYASHNASAPQLPVLDTTAFYGTADERYLLDAYTRFTVMEEVLSEYVPGVQVHRRNKHFVLRVYNTRYREFFDGEPLILLDGVPVVDTDRLMAFSPLKIRSLDVVTKRYFLGYSMLPGIISFKTYKGDLAGFQLDPHSVVLEYDGLQAQREFASPQYASPTQLESRLPDFRNLLYWNPQVLTNAQGKSALSFYTSDQDGTYRVVVQGMTADGRATRSQQTFVVQPIVK